MNQSRTNPVLVEPVSCTEFNPSNHNRLLRFTLEANKFLKNQLSKNNLARVLAKNSLLIILLSALMSISFSSLAKAKLIDQEKVQPPHAGTSLKIGVLGDSLSAAYNLNIEQGWISLIEQRLQHAITHRATSPHTKTTISADTRPATIPTTTPTSTPRIATTKALFNLGLSEVTFFNASVSGATTDAGLQILPSLLHKQPDVVFLELGANDGLQGKPISHITNNLSTMIERIQKNGGEVVLLGMHLPPNMGKRYTQPFFKQYETLAKQYKTYYVPFLLEGVAGNTSLMMQDGLHPNIEGQKVIADTLWPTIQYIITEHIAKKKKTK